MGASERRDAGSDPESPKQPFRLFIEEEAKHDLVDAATYYETEQEGLAIRFHEAVWQMFERVLDNPFQYPAVTRTLRRAQLARFPHAIYYAVSERRHLVDVVSVHHGKRRPEIWRRRKPTWRK